MLFFKECKQIFKSIIYYIFIICLFAFYITQTGAVVRKPIEGQDNYGYKVSEDKQYIMQSTLDTLILEYKLNKYVAYPIGFYREVNLNDKNQNKIAAILEELTGLSLEQIEKRFQEMLDNGEIELQYFYSENEYVDFLYMLEDDNNIIKVPENLTYDKFMEFMKQADKIIGGGSKYSEEFIIRNAEVPMTYEDAKQEYESIINDDKISRAYARLFCDYLGIILSILPVFLIVSRILKDKNSNVSQIIYSRKISSVKIVLTRYFANVFMILIPTIIISILPYSVCKYYAIAEKLQIDDFAFIKYIFIWLLPNIMVVLAVGFLFTEITESAIAILIQGIWWFISVFISAGDLVGHFGLNFIPRFNTIGSSDIFKNSFNEFLINRCFYLILSIILIIFTIIIFEMKRKGVIIKSGKIFKNRKSKSKI